MTSYALVISNNYQNFPYLSLNGCFNDGDNFISTIKKINPKTKFVIMRDNLNIKSKLFPSRVNILREFNLLITSSYENLYFHYSGHGTTKQDYNKDETINLTPIGREINITQGLLQDSCIVSNDITNINLITDDELNNILIKIKSNQKFFGFMDSCNSGTGLDLCWINMAKYSEPFNFSKSINNINQLKLETTTKCSILSSNYPDKINKIKSNVFLISGTRDNSYSYEALQNGKHSGYFTTNLCWLLHQDIWSFSLREFYLCLVGLINIDLQIPILTMSNNINIDLFKMNNFISKTTNNKNNKNKTKTKTKKIINNKIIRRDIGEINDWKSKSKLLFFYLVKSKENLLR